MTEREIKDYLSSKGIDLRSGMDPRVFRLEDTLILCNGEAYLSVDFKSNYFRTHPLVSVPLKSVTSDLLDKFTLDYREWLRRNEEENRKMRTQKMREAIALRRKS